MKRNRVLRYIAGVEDKDWEAFRTKYKGHVSERIRKLIEMDLEEKLPEGEGVLTSYKRKRSR